MPRRNTTRVPSYRLHRPTGQAVVTLAGKDFYLGPHGSATSKVEYDRLVAEWAANGRLRPPASTATNDLVINELILAYLNHAKAYYVKDGKPTSEQCGIRRALAPLQALYGRVSATNFGPLALKTVRQAMIDADLCRGVVNQNVGRIKRAFKWATESELIPPNVFHGLAAVSGLRVGRSAARETTPVMPVPDEYVAAIRPYVSRQVCAMIQLQLLTGMRSGEVASMRGCDLNMNGKLWLYRPAGHKTEHHGHKRIVELGPRAQSTVKPFLKAETTAFLFSPRDAEVERRALQHAARATPISRGNRPGTNRKQRPKRHARDRYDKNSYRRAIVRACDRADQEAKRAKGLPPDGERLIPRWHPHQLRHSFATRIRREYGLETARILLGHRSAAVTEIYAEVDRAKVASIIGRVG